jgi:outer membrane protein assembly factor BamB
VTGADHSSGDIVISPRPGYQRHVRFDSGPEIVNGHGELVWFRNLGSQVPNNLEVQRYHGQRVLTWWQGSPTGQHAQDMIVDSSYRTVAIVRAAEGQLDDVHEFQITAQDTALIDTVVPIKADLSKIGGPSNGTLDDNEIQELDVKTGKELWSWHALGHVPISDSRVRPSSSGPYDYFHLNSIQQLPNGNLVISARATWGVYEISKQTGKIIWQLGTKHSNFKLGPGANYAWQHDARLSGGSTLSLFDDGSDGPDVTEGQSSGKVLNLNFATKTATLVHRYRHSPPVLAIRQGNVQTLPNANRFVGWGSVPEFSEYTAGGRQIFNGTFALGVESYRAYLVPWTARPALPPAMANQPGPGGAVTVYASWNGATDVAAWRVLGGPAPGALSVLDPHTPKREFESAIRLHSEPRYFAVQALDSAGHVLATSRPHLDRPHLAIFGSRSFVTAGGGTGAVPVGCLAAHDCTLALTIAAGGSTLARVTGVHLSAGTGGQVRFGLSARGRRALQRAAGRGVPVDVTVRDGGLGATTRMTLTPYSVSGSTPTRNVTQGRTVRIVDANVFVSASGRGGILAACYASAPCHPRASISVNGTTIASSRPEHVGTNELGDVYFQLNPAGKRMLARASGNQLGAQIKLTSGGEQATGQVDLIGYR